MITFFSVANSKGGILPVTLSNELNKIYLAYDNHNSV